MLQVQAVLTSALVAAVVTLGIEFFAKPRLEARRDRVLEQYRRHRAVRQHADVLTHWLGRLIGLIRERSTASLTATSRLTRRSAQRSRR